MKEYIFKFHPDFEKQLKKMNKTDRKLVEETIEKIKEKPYIGKEINSNCFDKLRNIYKRTKRDLEIKVIKWKKNTRK